MFYRRVVRMMPLSSCTEVEKLIKTDPIEDHYDIGPELGRLANSQTWVVETARNII